MTQPRYSSIVAHYEACLAEHGDSHLGVDWPNAADAETRYKVMLDVILRPLTRTPTRVLDFGCGAAHLNDYIVGGEISDIEYIGLDISPKFVELSRTKFPRTQFWCADVLTADQSELPSCDYAVMNGVFTEKVDLSFDEMTDFCHRVVKRVFGLAKVGIAFNLMSKHVDWERDDLFHVPFDDVASFLRSEVSEHFIFRQDYGLHEFTTYVYH